MNLKNLQLPAILLSVATVVSCNSNTDSGTMANESSLAPASSAVETEKAVVKLFDGESLGGWHAFNKPGEITNWTVEDGAMVCLGAAKGDTGGDIVSDTEYENFELSWEWKIEKGGNSGLMYHVIEDSKYKAPYETGPEYQMYDDKPETNKLQSTGADYAMYAANDKKKANPAGEWNTSKIIFDKGHVEHWLNGEKIVAFQAWSDEWENKKKEGKWNKFPDYGVAKKGKIALQDHGKKTWFRNITIKEL